MARRDARPDPKEAALAGARCLNPHPEQVTDAEFLASEFFDARDAVQVKYEMVRKVRAAGVPVTEAAAAFGYSRPAYYAAAAALESSGLEGLVPGPARAARRQQAHRGDPRLGRGAARRQPRAAPGAAAGPDRGGLRRARAPPLGRASAGPPPRAPLQKMTCIGLLGSLAAEPEALLRCAGRPPQLRRVTINRVSNPRAGRWCALGSLRRSRCPS